MSHIGRGSALAMLLCTALLAAAASAAAAEPTAEDLQRAASRHSTYARCGPAPRWEFGVSLPVWIPGVSGSLVSGDVTLKPDDEPGDGLGNLDKFFQNLVDLQFGFLGEVHVRRGAWFGAVDGFGVNLDRSVTFERNDGTLTDGNLWAAMARARAGYRALDERYGFAGRTTCLQVDVYAGVRYYRVGYSTNLAGGRHVKRSPSWWDPLMGIDVRWDLGRTCLCLLADVGGFGAGSDLALWVSGGVEYEFSRLFAVRAGWTVLDLTWSEGSAFDRAAVNLTLSGPVLALCFRF